MFHNVGGIKVSGGEVQRSPFFNPALIGKTMPAFIVVQSDRVVTTVGPGVLNITPTPTPSILSPSCLTPYFSAWPLQLSKSSPWSWSITKVHSPGSRLWLPTTPCFHICNTCLIGRARSWWMFACDSLSWRKKGRWSLLTSFLPRLGTLVVVKLFLLQWRRTLGCHLTLLAVGLLHVGPRAFVYDLECIWDPFLLLSTCIVVYLCFLPFACTFMRTPP